MYYGPLLMLFNGYWVMDNLQIFDNIWSFKENSYDHMLSTHTIQFRITQSSPMLFCCMISLAILFLRWVIPQRKLILAGLTMTPYIKEVNEELPSFFEALRIPQADAIVKQYSGIQELYGFETCDFELIDNIVNKAKCLVRKIDRTAWYTPLMNPFYAWDFEYTPRYQFSYSYETPRAIARY